MYYKLRVLTTVLFDNKKTFLEKANDLDQIKPRHFISITGFWQKEVTGENSCYTAVCRKLKKLALVLTTDLFLTKT